MAKNGDNVKLFVEDSPGSGNPIEIVGETQTEIEKTRDMIEDTTKSEDAKTYQYGNQDSTITVDILFEDSDTARSALEDAQENASTILVQEVIDGSATEEATALVETVGKTAPMNENAEYSVDLQVSGGWSTV